MWLSWLQMQLSRVCRGRKNPESFVHGAALNHFGDGDCGMSGAIIIEDCGRLKRGVVSPVEAK
jgi:hypothetical protein